MTKRAGDTIAALLLLAMCVLAGGAALRESATVDEVAHIGAGLSYLQRLDLRMNPEHPPLPKLLAAVPLVIRGARADYSSNVWTGSGSFVPAFFGQWVFGDAVLGRWNPWRPVLLWARVPMLALTLLLGWVVYVYGTRLGGRWGGLLCLVLYATTPVFLALGPLVITDLPVTLFSLIALWRIGEIWVAPTRRNTLLFGLALGASLLSKFTGLLLIPVAVAFVVQTRFWPTAEQPAAKAERKAWRRARWRSLLGGCLWAAAAVYVVYLLFSWNQPNDALDRVGGGAWAGLVRRPLMPIWLYLRGLFLMLSMGSRGTFLLGRDYPHGVPFYFPVVFALKSTLGFLLLLLEAAAAGIAFRRLSRRAGAIPAECRPHWRVIVVAFFVFLTACLLSRLNIGLRHFMIPIVLMILMLSTLPTMIQALPVRRLLQSATLLLVASSFAAIIGAYPYFFPFANSLTFGRPLYELVNDSNLTWNEGLPDVEKFVQRQGLTKIALDWASISDPTLVVPQAQDWDCQVPNGHAGEWVAVAAPSILDNRNCGYLLQFPQRVLAGGGFYAFHLPPSGAADLAAPPASARKQMWGSSFDVRGFFLGVERHPDTFEAAVRVVQRMFVERNAGNGSKQ